MISHAAGKCPIVMGLRGAKGAFSHVREYPLLIPQENGRGVSISPLHP